MSRAEIVAAQALQEWWLTGTTDPDMLEWWASQDAAETAESAAEVVVEALRGAGLLNDGVDRG